MRSSDSTVGDESFKAVSWPFITGAVPLYSVSASTTDDTLVSMAPKTFIFSSKGCKSSLHAISSHGFPKDSLSCL